MATIVCFRDNFGNETNLDPPQSTVVVTDYTVEADGAGDTTVIIHYEKPCPDCGCDPEDATLHRDECRRIADGIDVEMQFGPPWKPWRDAS